MSKAFFYHYKSPDKPRLLLLKRTGITAVKIGETTIYSDLGIEPETKLLGLNDKAKTALKDMLSDVKFLWYQAIYAQLLTQS